MARDYIGLPRAGVLRIDPSGADAAGPYRGTETLRLDMNSNPYGPCSAAVAAYRLGAEKLHHYPDVQDGELCEAIACVQAVDAAQIVAGPGARALVSLICRTYVGPGDEVLMPGAALGTYRAPVLACGATPLRVGTADEVGSLEELLAAVGPSTRMVILTNPNSVNGGIIPGLALRAFRAALPPEVLLVIDAAYGDYVEDGTYDAGDALVRDFGNVVVVRSFSLIHGLAGLRLGWLYAPSNVAEALRRAAGPHRLAAPAQGAGLAALWDTAHVDDCRTRNSTVMRDFSRRIRSAGYSVRRSCANFLMVDLRAFDGVEANGILMARSLCRHLAEGGIVVRPLADAGARYALRISMGLPEGMSRLAQTMESFAGVHLRRLAG